LLVASQQPEDTLELCEKRRKAGKCRTKSTLAHLEMRDIPVTMNALDFLAETA
jgi:hypothetical protein